MAGVCSRHFHKEPGCKLCNAGPWDVLGVSKEQWEAHSLIAESEGTLVCPYCGFDGMYKKTCREPDGSYRCPSPSCQKNFDLSETILNEDQKMIREYLSRFNYPSASQLKAVAMASIQWRDKNPPSQSLESISN